MDRHDPIAVFDSGVGGVSVLRELRRLMPGEHYLYFGDSANAPYGLKSTDEVRRLTLDAAEQLFSLGAKCLVVACNTATAAAIEDLRKAHPQRIIVGIEPALKLAADRHPGGVIGVMATEVTLREQKLEDLIQRCTQNCTVIPLHSPGIVELVESGMADSPEALDLIRQELSPYANRLDAIVLGCTHYPFVKKAIRAVVGDSVELLDGGEGTARETRRRLAQADLLTDLAQGELRIENSANDPRMTQLTRRLLDEAL